MPTDTKNHVISMTKKKETKGTVVYEEGESDTILIGTLYVKKVMFDDGIYPDDIKVTVEY